MSNERERHDFTSGELLDLRKLHEDAVAEAKRKLAALRDCWKDVEAALRAGGYVRPLDVITPLNAAVLRMRKELYGSLAAPKDEARRG